MFKAYSKTLHIQNTTGGKIINAKSSKKQTSIPHTKRYRKKKIHKTFNSSQLPGYN
jgi:hypothetical protein